MKISRTTTEHAVALLGALILGAGLSACGKASAGQAGVVSPERSADANSVTATWGPLVVREGEVDGQADRTPWSGSWLPLRSTYLFQSDDGSAPLQKYDQYMQEIHDKDSHAADFEKNNTNLYDPNALGWEGRCDAWATASIIEPEPTKPVTIGDITFTVGDLKALLTETYENTDTLTQFGQNFVPGLDFSEMYPDQFQRAVQHELVDHHRPMIFDNDPTEQVWNTPMYAAQFVMTGDSNDSTVMHVTAYISGVSPFVPGPDYVGSLTVDYIYTYDLYGTRQPDGSFLVVYGEWTGDSKIAHPNFVSVLSGRHDHSSINTEISTDVVNEILAKDRAQH